MWISCNQNWYTLNIYCICKVSFWTLPKDSKATTVFIFDIFWQWYLSSIKEPFRLQNHKALLAAFWLWPENWSLILISVSLSDGFLHCIQDKLFPVLLLKQVKLQITFYFLTIIQSGKLYNVKRTWGVSTNSVCKPSYSFPVLYC
jgi:hypothetical protein